jgi:hypothetical protein
MTSALKVSSVMLIAVRHTPLTLTLSPAAIDAHNGADISITAASFVSDRFDIEPRALIIPVNMPQG